MSAVNQVISNLMLQFLLVMDRALMITPVMDFKVRTFCLDLYIVQPLTWY